MFSSFPTLLRVKFIIDRILNIYMVLQTLRNASLRKKKIILRVDFNVPLKKGIVVSDKRIKAAIPTINYALSNGAEQLIIISHLGRPKGVPEQKYSLHPVAKKLQQLLKKKVEFIDSCIDVELPSSKISKIILLENLRFYPEEKKNSNLFAKKLASYGDIFVNDAFGTSHRKHASVHAITKLIPSYAGLLLESEIKNLDFSSSKPKRPFVVVLGGAKVSDKIGVIKNLSKKADTILVGGAMMFTFFKALGLETGKSLVEDDKLDLALRLLKNSKKKIILPIDIVCSSSLNSSKSKIYSVEKHPKNMIGLDIGPDTIEIYSSILKKAKTVVWNGPMGLFEKKPFDLGTNSIARAIVNSNAKSVIGGGDSVAAIEKLGFSRKISHISTGGGASLELLEGKKLPGIFALQK